MTIPTITFPKHDKYGSNIKKIDSKFELTVYFTLHLVEINVRISNVDAQQQIIDDGIGQEYGIS